MTGRSFQKPVVVVGSINTDLVCHVERIPRPGETLLGGDFKIYPGGKGANQAVAAGRLGCPVQMIGKLGQDAFADAMRASLRNAGVDVAAVETVDAASGVALIEVDAAGQNSIVVAPGANAHVLPADLDRHLDLLRGAGAVLAQLEIPLETVAHLAALCKRERIPLILDPAPARELPRELLGAVTWFTPNETEAAFYAGTGQPDAQCEALLAMGIERVILKRGADGLLLTDESGGKVQIPSFKVHAVDTTAAGDAFNGAFAAALMLGADAAEAARFAAAAAAVSVTRAGAQPSMAAREEVEELLRSQS